MSAPQQGLGIIFHSGSHDRVAHGLSIAIAARALGRDVRLFFTYWALEHLKKKEAASLKLDGEARKHKELIEKKTEKGHLQEIINLIREAKKMGASFSVCSGSMGLLNISRDELVDEVDQVMGLTAFLVETNQGQVIFI